MNITEETRRMFWGIDIKNGIVTYDDISFLTEDVNPQEQIDYLKEDMLQIAFPKNLLLDVGWRPSLNKNGAFYVALIKGSDWDNPIAQTRVFDIVSVKKALSHFIDTYVQE